MDEIELRAPVCPGCHQLPALAISIRQAFCGNDECRVFCWDMTEDPILFWGKAQKIDLPPWLGGPE